jgi:integrase
MTSRYTAKELETPTARKRLKVRRQLYLSTIARGVAIGYRRNIGVGSFSSHVADGKGGATINVIGLADDDPNIEGIGFWTAVERVKKLTIGSDASKPVTVKEALGEYAHDLKMRGGRSVQKVHRLIDILPPALLARPVGLLTARELKHWRDDQIKTGLAPSSVTRVCKTFKASLAYAAAHDEAITNKSAWVTGLKALPDSQKARTNAVLTDDEVRDIVAACWAYADWLGLYAETLATSGARPIQVARLVVSDLQSGGVLMPRSVKGKGKKRIDRRPMPLPATLVTKLRSVAEGRPADAPLLRRADGNGWSLKRSDYSVPWANALRKANLPLVVPYALRHSSITRALQRGIPARVVADHHDTSVAMLERNYSASIADYSEMMVRAAQIDLSPSPDPKVVPIGGRR